MASPQPEQGFTRIANELLDALIAADMTKRQLRVALAIVRQTYGYNRKEDDISGSRLAELTGLRRQHCNAALLELAALQVITRRTGRWGTRVSIQKDYERWGKPLDSTATGDDTEGGSGGLRHQNGVSDRPEEVTPKRCQVDTKTVSARHQNGVGSDTKTVHTIDSKDNIKDNFKHRGAVSHAREQGCFPFSGSTPKPVENLQARFDLWWSVYPKKRSKGQAWKAWQTIKPSEQQTADMIEAVQRAKTSSDWNKSSGQFIPHPATWLRGEGWLDEYSIDTSGTSVAVGVTVNNLQELFGNGSADVSATDGILGGSLRCGDQQGAGGGVLAPTQQPTRRRIR